MRTDFCARLVSTLPRRTRRWFGQDLQDGRDSEPFSGGPLDSGFLKSLPLNPVNPVNPVQKK
jgi:hypothetical protein